MRLSAFDGLALHTRSIANMQRWACLVCRRQFVGARGAGDVSDLSAVPCLPCHVGRPLFREGGGVTRHPAALAYDGGFQQPALRWQQALLLSCDVWVRVLASPVVGLFRSYAARLLGLLRT